MPVDSRHPCIEAQTDNWRRVRDVLIGPAAVKAKDRCTAYLPRLPGQRIVSVPGISGVSMAGLPPGVAVTGGTVDEYQIYLDRAVILSGFAERVLHGMVGMAMRKTPDFDVPTVMEKDLDNITLDGSTAAALAKQALGEDLSVSWGGILLDWSEQFGRPYQRLYRAESILDFRLGYVGGRPEPMQIRLAEEVEVPDPDDEWKQKCERQVRILQLVPDAELTAAAPMEFPLGRFVHRLQREVKQANGEMTWEEVTQVVNADGSVTMYPFTPLRRERPLGFIPFQPFNALNALWELTGPALLHLINMILAHYKNSADYENGIHAAGVPTFEVWGIAPRNPAEGPTGAGGQVELGPGRVIMGENPQGHAGWVQTGGQGCAEILAAMEGKKAEMAVMIARLLLSQERRVAQTAESQLVAFAGDDASLTSVVEAVEQALTNVCTWHAWWAGTYATVEDAGKDVSVKLNREFLAAAETSDDLVKDGMEVDAGRMPLEDYFLNGQRGGRFRPEMTFEEYLAELAEDQARKAAASGGDAQLRTELQGVLVQLRAAIKGGDALQVRRAVEGLAALVDTQQPAGVPPEVAPADMGAAA